MAIEIWTTRRLPLNPSNLIQMATTTLRHLNTTLTNPAMTRMDRPIPESSHPLHTRLLTNPSPTATRTLSLLFLTTMPMHLPSDP